MAGLDTNDSGTLPAVVSRDVKPSPLFQGAWDLIEQARKIRGLDQEATAQLGGFERSSWYVYKRLATIPLNNFAQLVRRLGLKYRLDVRPVRGYVNRTDQDGGVVMPDDTEEGRAAAEAINDFTDPGIRAKLLSKLLQEALKHRRPSRPPPPVAIVKPDPDR